MAVSSKNAVIAVIIVTDGEYTSLIGGSPPPRCFPPGARNTAEIIMRSVFAVLAGYAIFALSTFALFRISGQEAHAAASVRLIAVSVVYAGFFAFCAGYTAARLAPSRPLIHGGVIAAFIAIAALASLFARPEQGAIWSQLIALLVVAPAVLAGAYVST
jgi:hypothetical protein